MSATQSDLARVIEATGIADRRLIEAFGHVPRADFVPPEQAAHAYEDRPLPIPHGQVTTQPSLTAKMIDALELRSEDRVLEIGTGHGFQTALVSRLAESVVSIERYADLAEQASLNLARHHIENVDIRIGDGSLGVPDRAPFDAVIVSAAFPAVPEPISAQLAGGGRLVQPIGPGGGEVVTLFRKKQGRLHRVRTVVPAHFVRLIGAEGFPESD